MIRQRSQQGQSMGRPLAGDQLGGSGVSWLAEFFALGMAPAGARQPSVGRSSDVAGMRRGSCAIGRRRPATVIVCSACGNIRNRLSNDHQELAVISLRYVTQVGLCWSSTCRAQGRVKRPCPPPPTAVTAQTTAAPAPPMRAGVCCPCACRPTNNLSASSRSAVHSRPPVTVWCFEFWAASRHVSPDVRRTL